MISATASPAQFGDTGGIFALRAGLPEDHAFVFATWLRCYKRNSLFARRISNETFFRWHHLVIERILARSVIRVAHAADAPEVILGYSVSEPGVVHFVYVKGSFRKLGIATALLGHLDPNACVFTHWTDGWEHLLRKWPNAEYNPYAI